MFQCFIKDVGSHRKNPDVITLQQFCTDLKIMHKTGNRPKWLLNGRSQKQCPNLVIALCSEQKRTVMQHWEELQSQWLWIFGLKLSIIITLCFVCRYAQQLCKCNCTCTVRTGTVSSEPFCCSTSSFSLSIRSCFRASALSASSSRLHRSPPWDTNAHRWKSQHEPTTAKLMTVNRCLNVILPQSLV